MAKRSAPEVNAGSMADIAFLLLIFFLVTTTIETDSGLNRKLPPMEDQVDPPIIRQKNIFTVLVSKNDQLLVEEELADIKDLRSLAVEFLDNGGGVGDETCDYCQGKRDEASSDNPDKAIISLKSDRETSYKIYIAVQNELVAAYNELRNREFLRLNPNLGSNYVDAQKKYDDPRTSEADREELKPKLDFVKKMYPQKLSEAESTSKSS
ncbi:biopolymer transporter ExbD [Flavobacteriaceae bacterium]|jgi:biopolymer transport protein ExbD|nr:biopolymer transporter ExbD [Flavobacteriaceae bacterium]MDC1377895.1 biopolymer transporter ExbD [Flavobacteriaceae bacterium]|tara:strand:- start:1292 stop:1918 length:627 start_codon:yes stop_codon:yes gene_type:complete